MEIPPTNNRFNVVVRIRPEIEEDSNQVNLDEDLIHCISKTENRLSISRQNIDVKEFEFDNIIEPSSTQEEAYKIIGSKIISDVMEGYNGTIMAYGQTGSGKTFTIFGKKNSMDYSEKITKDMGIIPRSIKQIFNYIDSKEGQTKFQLKVSFMQIYKEQISDLIILGNETRSPILTSRGSISKEQDLKIREDPNTGIFVEGLKQIKVTGEEDMLELIRHGSKNRFTSSTAMNNNSSRSHAILQILVEQQWIEENEQNPALKKRHYKKGLLTIVDLAGSERISKTGSTGNTSKEAIMINKSISELGNCINALANNSKDQHVPFRNSKLTRVLTECLGGNAKTSICACISPFLMNYDETLTTLQCASRAMKIRVDPKIFEKIEMKSKASIMLNLKNAEEILEKKDKIEKEENDVLNRSKGYRDEKKGRKGSELTDEINSSSGVMRNNNNDNIDENDNVSLLKKFHSIIIKLQDEAANQALIIYNLNEENSRLREQIKNLTGKK